MVWLRHLAVALLIHAGLCSKGDATYEKLIAAGIEASKTNMAGAKKNPAVVEFASNEKLLFDFQVL